MTRYLLAGGGTAGHVNPLLAVADRLRERDPDAVVLVLGTAEGLESRLVPARGYELLLVDRLPFPRRPSPAVLRFPGALAGVVARIGRYLDEHAIDVVVGFGGYVAAPAYLAARRGRIPVVIHEGNARAGMANRLGSLVTRFTGAAFPGTGLRSARVVGMPLRREIERLDRPAARREAQEVFGLDPVLPTLLVTGGSLGAHRINETVSRSAQLLLGAGWQILHITGTRSEITYPSHAGYHVLPYCDRMDLAIAVADLAVARAGSSTVSELTAVGVPAVYVPLPIGNGEQRLNARQSVDAGAALLVEDDAFTEQWVASGLLALLQDGSVLAAMAASASMIGVRDGTDRMVALVDEAVAASAGQTGTGSAEEKSA